MIPNGSAVLCSKPATSLRPYLLLPCSRNYAAFFTGGIPNKYASPPPKKEALCEHHGRMLLRQRWQRHSGPQNYRG